MHKNLVKILKDFYNKYQNEPWVISDDELTKKSNKRFFVRDYRFKISIFNKAWVGGDYWKNYTFCFAVSTGDISKGESKYFDGAYIFVVFPKKIEMVIISKYIQEHMETYNINGKDRDIYHYERTFNQTGRDNEGLYKQDWGIRNLKDTFYKIKAVERTPQEEIPGYGTFEFEYSAKNGETLDDELVLLEKRIFKKDEFWVQLEFAYIYSDFLNIETYNLFLAIHKEVLKEKNKDIENKLKPLLDEFDKNGNGTVDILEGGDDFMKLVRKHQKKIIDVDKNHLQSFVKLSNYLSSKRENIQLIFENLSKSSEIKELEQTKKMLKYQIHIYELQLSMGILMIVSLIDDDHITYFEIYECFAKLDVFNSKWQNDIYKKLTSIDTGIYDLMISIQEFEESMVAQIRRLTNISSDSISNLKDVVTKELKGINSGMEFNNLLGVINTYQNYKTRKIIDK